MEDRDILYVRQRYIVCKIERDYMEDRDRLYVRQIQIVWIWIWDCMEDRKATTAPIPEAVSVAMMHR